MLTTPILRLNPERVGDIDPRDFSSLFGMWAVFSRCAQSIPDGRRLKNLSWRLWARETLCCPPKPYGLTTPVINIPPTASAGVPSLAGSIDTEPDEHSALSKSRGEEPHLNPRILQNMVFSIQQKSRIEPLEAALSAKIHSISVLSPERPDVEMTRQLQSSTDPSRSSAITAGNTRRREHRDSETSVSSSYEDGIIRSSLVVCSFFSPNGPRLSQFSKSEKSSIKTLAPSKAGIFTLGGSSEGDSSSFKQQMTQKRDVRDKPKSSLPQSLTRDINPQKKTTSFRDIVEPRIQKGLESDKSAIACDDDDDDDDVIESAILEEDEDDWEEMPTDDETQAQAVPAPVFKRVESRPNLVSRRSILTQGLIASDGVKDLLDAPPQPLSAKWRTRTTSHASESPAESERMMMTGGSEPLPMMTTASNTNAMAQSPRATRRAMLSTELTESLRNNILLERQGKQANLSFMRRQAVSKAKFQ